MAEGSFRTAVDTENGRVLVSDSLSYCDDRVDSRDVIVGASFAGVPTVALALARGVRGVIAHAAGVGKDAAGISGLPLADRSGTPAAAVETMSARISDGESLYKGAISHANSAASRLGITPGMSCSQAAMKMMLSSEGTPTQFPSVVDTSLHEVERLDGIVIYAIWSLMLVKGRDPLNIYCAASHAGKVMADYALKVMPRAVFANDAGGCLDGSGFDGLPMLDRAGVAAVAVAAMSSRIGDALSTYHDGICSVVNETAARAGVTTGMSVKAAARFLAAS